MNKFFSYLGLSMRAGKLVSGDEAVMKAVRSGHAKLVIIATDASSNTFKKFSDKCRHYNVLLVQRYTRAEIGRSIGKENRVIVAVIDQGFASMMREVLEKQTEV